MYDKKYTILTLVVAIALGFSQITSKIQKEWFEYATIGGEWPGLPNIIWEMAPSQEVFMYSSVVVGLLWWKCGSHFERAIGLKFKNPELEQPYLAHVKKEVPNNMHMVCAFLLVISPLTFFFGSTPTHEFYVTNAIVFATMWIPSWRYYVYTFRLVCVFGFFDVAINGMPWVRAIVRTGYPHFIHTRRSPPKTNCC